jgi:hypothetical protein
MKQKDIGVKKPCVGECTIAMTLFTHEVLCSRLLQIQGDTVLSKLVESVQWELGGNGVGI